MGYNVHKNHSKITNLFTGFTRTIHSHTHGQVVRIAHKCLSHAFIPVVMVLCGMDTPLGTTPVCCMCVEASAAARSPHLWLLSYISYNLLLVIFFSLYSWINIMITITVSCGRRLSIPQKNFHVTHHITEYFNPQNLG